jgi:hypothetical protein
MAVSELYHLRGSWSSYIWQQRRLLLPDEHPHPESHEGHVSLHIVSVCAIPRPSHVLHLRMPELGHCFPGVSDHYRTVLRHNGIFGQILCPQQQAKQRNAGVCARVEFGQGVVAVKEVNDVLSVPMKSKCLNFKLLGSSPTSLRKLSCLPHSVGGQSNLMRMPS